ncbi:hypothetical protein VNO77_22829 [Canavalia gladiata]|uniref:Uncharacterized protein n=1 Tax=Canavalia gladiata TaxID=3824 RepID=A0AAN9QB55_CANGL
MVSRGVRTQATKDSTMPPQPPGQPFDCTPQTNVLEKLQKEGYLEYQVQLTVKEGYSEYQVQLTVGNDAHISDETNSKFPESQPK